MALEIVGLKLYNVTEIASMLKSTKSTIRIYFKSGRIKGRKINGLWYITEENLKSYLMGDNPKPISIKLKRKED